MAGITKRKYISENIRIYKKITNQLHLIKQILPEVYDRNILFAFYFKYFPSTIKELDQRHDYFKSKDIFLKSIGKKIRYEPLNSKEFFFSSQKVKHMLSDGYRTKHKLEYNEELKIKTLDKLEKKSNKTLEKDLFISNNNDYIQDIEPIYIDVFIKIYHKSNHIEKILIFNELKKFNNSKTITFFSLYTTKIDNSLK